MKKLSKEQIEIFFQILNNDGNCTFTVGNYHARRCDICPIIQECINFDLDKHDEEKKVLAKQRIKELI
jgi:hypothetical protein